MQQLCQLAVAIGSDPVGRSVHVAAGRLRPCSAHTAQCAAAHLQVRRAGHHNDARVARALQHRQEQLRQQIVAQEIGGKALVEALLGGQRGIRRREWFARKIYNA